MATHSQEWMIEVCKELGFEPNLVSNITIELDARNKVSLQIEADPKHSDTIVKLLRESGRWAYHATVLGEGETPVELVKTSPAWLREAMAQLRYEELVEFKTVLEQLVKEASGHIELIEEWEAKKVHAL